MCIKSLSLSLSIYIYICTYTKHAYTHTHTHIYIYIYIHICMCICICICMCICVCICICICVCVCVLVLVLVCVCVLVLVLSSDESASEQKHVGGSSWELHSDQKTWAARQTPSRLPRRAIVAVRYPCRGKPVKSAEPTHSGPSELLQQPGVLLLPLVVERCWTHFAPSCPASALSLRTPQTDRLPTLNPHGSMRLCSVYLGLMTGVPF